MSKLEQEMCSFIHTILDISWIMIIASQKLGDKLIKATQLCICFSTKNRYAIYCVIGRTIFFVFELLGIGHVEKNIVQVIPELVNIK